LNENYRLFNAFFLFAKLYKLKMIKKVCWKVFGIIY